ncbi:MAG: Mlc titration factor MtfA (ptsG expression regulator) [Arenicella sp.]|jgi:Mlc titration factor MtfA (ptsG expression regulator)
MAIQIAFLIFTVIILAIIGLYVYQQTNKPAMVVPKIFPPEWRMILERDVHFYQNLNKEEKKRFEEDIRHFLHKVRVTGIRTEVEDLDRLLVASSAVIPLFGFPTWDYNYLDEVLVYPKHFDKNFSMENPEEIILGMVGTGNGMDGMIILSKESLRQGYQNPTDGRNVGIHEFVHIMDKEDGEVDGIPEALTHNKYMEPWRELMEKEILKIRQGKSDIDAYGGTNEQEFFAVSSEYFFEKPKLMEQKHPEIYELLNKIYHQNMSKHFQNPFRVKKQLGRNSSCPCGSGEKFKNCCMKN